MYLFNLFNKIDFQPEYLDITKHVLIGYRALPERISFKIQTLFHMLPSFVTAHYIGLLFLLYNFIIRVFDTNLLTEVSSTHQLSTWPTNLVRNFFRGFLIITIRKTINFDVAWIRYLENSYFCMKSYPWKISKLKLRVR